MTRAVAAEVLGVTAQTVRNWEAGRRRVPYSAFKLMRILGGYELPGQAWRGFTVRGDTLWSPEGKAFKPADLAWWGLTVAMARSWREYREGLHAAAAQQVPPRGSPLALPQPSLPPAKRGGFTVRSEAGNAPRRRPAGGGAVVPKVGFAGLHSGPKAATVGLVAGAKRPPSSPLTCVEETQANTQKNQALTKSTVLHNKSAKTDTYSNI